METRANFALIGAFALAVVFAAFGFVFWFSGASQTAQYKTYEVHFNGSVSGLLRGGDVRFNGLKVGEVTQLAISEQDPSRVDVLVSIDRKTPVKTNTRARLEQAGFTGVSYVSLTGGTPGAEELRARQGETYPVIEGERSEFQNILENVQKLSSTATEVLDKVGKLLDANSQTISDTLRNTEKFTKALADNSGGIDSFIHDMSEISASMKPLPARIDKLLVAIDPKKLNSIATDIAGASANLRSFSGGGLKQYEQLAVDARKTLETVERAVRSLEKNPQQVIFGASPALPEYRGK
ncbi:phospholipid/cholesterol/gamma-HCH transport system substrate-binding protein [Methylosinus sp. sav-2]|uniref:MlaD family protein n=1 Tax=Methylosinus sp. sav-2 TaxID=2485168 RepID=UPI00047C26CA|nr:MlaD family protein [Methylosinus sp. sav-2]TDX65785.1 phospholipid/cholesterol/gamma-HCH transport system substrate-binding protein [Methylosinus sp. sav-2]